jgi:hypothetical protein
MSKKLISVVETYRVGSDPEAAMLIDEAKEDTSFVLKKYNSEYKEKKAKGEVIDQCYVVKLTKEYYSSVWDA